MQRQGAKTPTVLRYAAFAATPASGNPTGIVLDATGLADSDMQRIAADVGYAETAFVTERDLAGNPRHLHIRSFSPVAEVPFCGHATIATAVVLAEREGTGAFEFETPAGPVMVETSTGNTGITASFTSVKPEVAPLDGGAEHELLKLLGLAHEFRGTQAVSRRNPDRGPGNRVCCRVARRLPAGHRISNGALRGGGAPGFAHRPAQPAQG